MISSGSQERRSVPPGSEENQRGDAFIFNEVNKRMFEESVKAGHDSKEAKLGVEGHHLQGRNGKDVELSQKEISFIIPCDYVTSRIKDNISVETVVTFCSSHVH